MWKWILANKVPLPSQLCESMFVCVTETLVLWNLFFYFSWQSLSPWFFIECWKSKKINPYVRESFMTDWWTLQCIYTVQQWESYFLGYIKLGLLLPIIPFYWQKTVLLNIDPRNNDILSVKMMMIMMMMMGLLNPELNRNEPNKKVLFLLF